MEYSMKMLWFSPPWKTPALTPVLLALTLTMIRTAGGLQCNTAQQNCLARMGCSMALQNYLMACGQVIHGEINTCPARCRKALISLLSTEDEEGKAFMECDCNDNRFCETQKERMEVCRHDVRMEMDSVQDECTIITCSLAEQVCRADTSCLTALHYFDRKCHRLELGQKCTKSCNNSLGILFRQTQARKLRTCTCDGTETYACHALQESIDRLCYHRVRHVRKHNHTRSHDRPHQQDGCATTPVETKDREEEVVKTEVDPADCSNTSTKGNSIQCPSTSSSSSSATLYTASYSWLSLLVTLVTISRFPGEIQ